MPRRRPAPRRPDPPAPRRLHREPAAPAPAPDPWDLDALVAEVEARIAAHAAASPGDPPHRWLYAVLDAWAADRVDAWRTERAASGLPVIRDPACRPACDHCCHQHVAVTAIEAEILARHVLDRLPAAEARSIRARIVREAENHRRIAADSPSREAERAALARLRRPCPLLDESSRLCLAYDARPVNCRRENSVDADVCLRYRLDPDATDSSLRLVREDLIWGAAHVALARRSADSPSPDPNVGPDEATPLTSLPLAVALAPHFE